MALIATSSGTGREFKPVPAGNHVGRCYRVIDLGTQRSEWQGKVRHARKVMISWELFGEEEDGTPLTMEDGSPLSISSRYTLSLNENATLRHMLEGWRGRAFTDDELAGFDLSKLLGIYGLINVTHTAKDGKTYSNVAAVSPLPKALRDHKPVPVNENQFFDVTEPDMELFETFSEKLQETIKSCGEWNKESANAAAKRTAPGDGSAGMGGMDSDIP